MKVHQMAGLELWEQEPSLSLACKRPRPLAVPKLGHTLSIADLKSFIKPHNNVPTKSSPPQSHEVQSGGTRWNPTGEQIGILERLYRGGMRTPNAEQIEQITLQLGKYGKIEGKNVFYWFQNHKARERQRRKRVVDEVDKSTTPAPTPALHAGADQEEDQLAVAQMNLMKSWVPEVMRGFDESRWYKRFRPWLVKSLEDDEEKGEQGIQTLELFPLRPGGTS